MRRFDRRARDGRERVVFLRQNAKLLRIGARARGVCASAVVIDASYAV
jgi:hypothetical protein